MQEKILAVITPVFNDKEAFQFTSSNFQLEHNLVEFLIVDGGSIDGSREIANNLQVKYSNVKTMQQSNSGLYSAFNEGIENSNAEFIVFNHCGDVLDVELVIKNIYKNRTADIIACSATQNAGISIKSHVRSEMGDLGLQSTRIIQPALVVRKSTYHLLNGYDSQYDISADVDFVIRALKKKSRIVYSDDIIVHMEKFRTSRIHLFTKIWEHYKIKKTHVGFLHANTYLFKRIFKEIAVYPILRMIRRIKPPLSH